MNNSTNTKACVIFDIDGTLVDSSAFESELYISAITDVIGEVSIRADWHEYKHVTDAGIVSEILLDNELDTKDQEREIRERFGELVAAYLSDGGLCPEIAGARTIFDEWKRIPELGIGIATGGWGHTAKMKLEHVGLDVSGIPIASADDHAHRVGIMRHCRSRMWPGANTVYIGDGEWDKQASDELGWVFIGIGSALKGKCDRWAPDLTSLQLSDLC